jgi:hypothetical protein
VLKANSLPSFELGLDLSEDYARSASSSVTKRARSGKKVSISLVGCNINSVDMSVNVVIIEEPESIV